MNNIFKIKYFKQKVLFSEPLDFSEEEYVDASLIFLSLEHFVAMYQGTFILKVGNVDLPHGEASHCFVSILILIYPPTHHASVLHGM